MQGETTFRIRVTDLDIKVTRDFEYNVAYGCPWELTLEDTLKILYAIADGKDGVDTNGGYISFLKEECE